MNYVSIDIETLGLNPYNCDTIEFAAVLENHDGTQVNDLPVFQTYLLPPDGRDYYMGQPYAMSMHAKILRRIATREKPHTYHKPDELGDVFKRWLEVQDLEQPITVAGKNFAGFDMRFLRMMEGFTNKVKIHHRVIDPAMYYFHPSEHAKVPSTAECVVAAGIPATNITHEAIDDARLVIDLIRYAKVH